MRHRLAYQLLAEAPHIPPALLARRFEAKLAPADEGGCRLWRGAVRKRGDASPEVGQMRLKTPTGSMLVPAPQVAWFLGGRGWQGPHTYFRRTCGQALCCALEHLAAEAKVDRRRLSVAQVLECRELYWGQPRRPQQAHAAAAATPACLASRRLGITVETVRRVMGGQAVSPGSWNNWQLTLEDVREAVADAEAAIGELRRGDGAVWTQQRLARRYGVELTTITQAISGLLYKDVGGPTSAGEAHAARAAAAREEARRARQASQGEAGVAARAACAS